MVNIFDKIPQFSVIRKVEICSINKLKFEIFPITTEYITTLTLKLFIIKTNEYFLMEDYILNANISIVIDQ